MHPRPLAIAALLALAASSAAAQTDSTVTTTFTQTVTIVTTDPIQDNSFLVEEAYNQDPGVVQHISNFARDRGGDWAYSLTQEWPLGGVRNQVSYTLPLVHAGDQTRIGDVMVNYRYQWIGDAEAQVAVAPRLSAILPTGSARRGFGAGAFGVQGAIPLSVVVVDRVLVAHSNLGVTYFSRAQDPAGNRGATTSFFAAQSAVWLVRPMFNVLVEGVWARDQFVTGPNSTGTEERAVISPGIRFGWNLPGGVQVVPGVAVPFGIGASEGERALFLYFSVEHPFKRQR